MRKPVLITSQNIKYTGILEASGFACLSYELCDLKDENINKLDPPEHIPVIEIHENNLKDLILPFNTLSEKEFDIIAVTETCTERIKHALMDFGIARLVVEKDIRQLPEYISSFPGKKIKAEKSALLLDNSPRHSHLILQVLEEFGYSLDIVTTINDFFENIEKNSYELSMVNLNVASPVLKKFVSKASLCPLLKQIAFIMFKDMSDGIFVHEFTTGLNRITKVILSLDEMLSLLVNMLFRKAIFPVLNNINSSLEFDSLSGFISDPMSRIYNTLGMELLSFGDGFTDEQFGSLGKNIHQFRKIFTRLCGLKWLLMAKNQMITCGQGV